MQSIQSKLTNVGNESFGIQLHVIPILLFFSFFVNTVKLHAQAPEFVYGKQYTTDYYQEATGIATDSAGFIYTTGFFSGTVNFKPAEGGSFIKTSNGLSDIFIIKTNSQGEPVWLKTIGGPDEDRVNSFSIVNNNIILTGSFYDSVDFNPGLSENIFISKGEEDIFILTLDLSGNYVSGSSIGGLHNDAALGIKADAQENVYVCGYFSDAVDFDLGLQANIKTSAGLKDMFIAKYNSTGFLIYVQTFGSSGNEQLKTIEVDAGKNVFAVGTFNNMLSVLTETGVQILNSEGSTDVLVTYLKPDGVVRNVKSFGGKKNDDAAFVISDEDNNIYISGSFADTVNFNDQISPQVKVSAGASDVYVLKLDQYGMYANVFVAGSKLSDDPTSLIIGEQNQIITTGFFQDTFKMETQSGIFSIVSKGLVDPFLLKLDSRVNFRWVGNPGSAYNDVFTDLLIDSGNNIIVTGFSGPEFNADFINATNFLPGNAMYNILSLQYDDNNCILPGKPSIIAPVSSICPTEQIVLKLADTALNSAQYWEWRKGDCNGPLLGTGDSILIQQNETTTYFARGAGGCVTNATCGSAIITSVGCFTVTGQAETVSCFGGTTSLQAIAQNGTAPFTYSIDNINFTSKSTFTVPAGTYTLYAKDAAGHSDSSEPYSVIQPAQLAVAGTCYSPVEKYLGIQASGGTKPYQFSRNGTTYFTGNQRGGSAYVFFNVNPNIHTLSVKDSEGCEVSLQVKTDTLVVCPIAGPAAFTDYYTAGNNLKITDPNIIIKPNPSASYFEINLKGNTNKIITVANAKGVIIFSAETNESRIITGERWPAGIYILQITENNKSTQHKLIKL